jgi:hypothetical protein
LHFTKLISEIGTERERKKKGKRERATGQLGIFKHVKSNKVAFGGFLKGTLGLN